MPRRAGSACEEALARQRREQAYTKQEGRETGIGVKG
jgi:hypothetical protein